jgi:hypothetical protein
MPWTFEEVRPRHPHLTDAQVRKIVELLNTPPQALLDIWESEAQVSGELQYAGPDGLTKPMREVNRYAEENALPIPFPPRTE